MEREELDLSEDERVVLLGAKSREGSIRVATHCGVLALIKEGFRFRSSILLLLFIPLNCLVE